MSNYIRPKIAGATVFFTVALADRGSSLLVAEVERLRQAVLVTRLERPFAIDAWVVSPDHMHCVWTLPDGDLDFATRWGGTPPYDPLQRFRKAMRACGKGDFGSIT